MSHRRSSFIAFRKNRVPYGNISCNPQSSHAFLLAMPCLLVTSEASGALCLAQAVNPWDFATLARQICERFATNEEIK